MGEMAVGAILSVQKDLEPSNIVNKEVWQKRRK